MTACPNCEHCAGTGVLYMEKCCAPAPVSQIECECGNWNGHIPVQCECPDCTVYPDAAHCDHCAETGKCSTSVIGIGTEFLCAECAECAEVER